MNQKIVSVHPTKYWHMLEDGRVQCDICPRGCKLKEDQHGFCFVRARQNNQVVLISYNLSTGFCIDPIEKKPLNHFLPGTAILSFGTAGCNLGCLFCQNWDISKAHETAILSKYATPKSIAIAAKNNGCQSVAFTYNDPVVFMEYAIDTAKECRKLGIKTVAVTNGYMCEKPRAEFYENIDAANVDLKGFTDDFYRKIAFGELKPVLDTLVYLKEKTNVWLEITTLLISGYNDSEKEIDKLTKWVFNYLGPNVPLHFTAFYPAWKMQNVEPTPPETVIRAREIALKNGLYYPYVGNIHDMTGSITYCHKCGEPIIERGWHYVTKFILNEAAQCPHCKTKCAGIFEKELGGFAGSIRQICIDDDELINAGKQHG